MAYGVLKAAKELGLKVPLDLSVIGHDNLPASSQTDPALTTMELPTADTAERRAIMLLERIKTPNAKPVHDIREVHLIERGSIAPPTIL
jgi:DNA-binding LacI/PurR family transcriptional regulator